MYPIVDCINLSGHSANCMMICVTEVIELYYCWYRHVELVNTEQNNEKWYIEDELKKVRLVNYKFIQLNVETCVFFLLVSNIRTYFWY